MIDLDALIPGVQTLRLREALYLEKWNCFLYPSPMQYKNIIKLAQVAQSIRNRFNKPLVVHSWLRIPAYSELIGSKVTSFHHTGGALDFHLVTIDCDEVREELKKFLVHYGIRLENNYGKNWIHIDIKPVTDDSQRFFLP